MAYVNSFTSYKPPNFISIFVSHLLVVPNLIMQLGAPYKISSLTLIIYNVWSNSFPLLDIRPQVLSNPQILAWLWPIKVTMSNLMVPLDAPYDFQLWFPLSRLQVPCPLKLLNVCTVYQSANNVGNGSCNQSVSANVGSQVSPEDECLWRYRSLPRVY